MNSLIKEIDQYLEYVQDQPHGQEECLLSEARDLIEQLLQMLEESRAMNDELHNYIKANNIGNQE